MKHIFLDTNIFLHYQDFETIDWLKESSSEICKLIIPPIVIDELDEKKIGTTRISNKARSVLNRIEELIENEIKEIQTNILFEVLINKPSMGIYEDNNLNFNEQDHRLIASIIQFRNERAITDIELCTHDIGPRLRAIQYGIKARKINDKYLLPIQDSDEEKKIKKLEQENKSLKIRIPNLTLRFLNENEFIVYKVPKQNDIDFDVYKAQKMIEIMTSNPPLKPQEQSKNSMDLFASLAWTSSQINVYNQQLDDFYIDYENSLSELFYHGIKENLTFKTGFILKNEGNVPAEDIDIHLHFPDGFELIESSKNENIIELPEPPILPKNKFDFGLSHLTRLPSFPNIDLSYLNLNSPNIKKTNSYDVDYYIKSLKHGYSEKLEEISIIYNNFPEIENFKIEYEISADNIPKKITGQLNVKYEK